MPTAELINKFEYLGVIKTELKNTFACLSEAQMGSNHEKKSGGRKSRDTLSLRKLFLIFLTYEYCTTGEV